MTSPQIDYRVHKLFDEQTWTISHEADLTNGDINLYFKAPSNESVLIYFMQMSNENEVGLALYSAVSSVSGGSDASPQNNQVGGSGTLDGTYQQDVTFTGDTAHSNQSFIAEQTQNILGQAQYQLVLRPGEEMVINLTDNSGASGNTASVRVAFIEMTSNQLGS